jgi:hypothetical protein
MEPLEELRGWDAFLVGEHGVAVGEEPNTDCQVVLVVARP